MKHNSIKTYKEIITKLRIFYGIHGEKFSVRKKRREFRKTLKYSVIKQIYIRNHYAKKHPTLCDLPF